MGQNQSNLSESSIFLTSESQNDATTSSSSRELEPKLTPIEITSLRQIYSKLKSVNDDGVELVTEETFQKYLGLPADMLFGKLLYRSFVQLPFIGNYEAIPGEPKLSYALLLYSTRFYCGKDQSLTFSGPKGSDFSSQTKLLFESFCAFPTGETQSENFQDDKKVTCQDLLELCKGILWILKAHYLMVLSSKSDLNELVIDEKIITSLIQQMAIAERESQGIPRGSFSFDLLEEEISWPTFLTVVQRNVPRVFKILERFIYTKFCVDTSLNLADSHKEFLVGVDSILPKIDLRSNILKIDDWSLLTWLLPESRGRSWDVLYTASEHGFNISHFKARVFNYPAATCLLIKGYPVVSRRLLHNRFLKVAHDPTFASKELILGAFIPEAWKFSREFWGSAECKLFELAPTYEVFPTTGSNNSYVYCHRSNGIGFGGSINEFRLHIKPDFQTGTYSNDPLHGTMSYKLSATRADFDVIFEIDDIEVIGLGGETAKQHQVNARLLEEMDIERGARVSSHSSEDTRQLLELAGILECSKKLDEFRTRKSLKLKAKSKPKRYAPYK
ncbi:Restriction of telomere capping protein 5 [Basidiobolus ranarum]|uniref:Restriction of telomere capping protein 5 n=1 Tax=Basidiobolus ranarum TaxID=34480 RepID=A0ABR2X4X0_9FUNG